MARKPNSRTGSRNSSASKRSARRARQASFLRLSSFRWAIISGIALVAAAGTAILSALSISQGTLTTWMWDEAIWPAFGYGGVVVPVAVGLTGLYLVLWGMEQSPRVSWDRAGGAAILFLAIEGLLHLLYLVRDPAASVHGIVARGKGGGYLGGGLVTMLESGVGRVGAFLLCIALAGIGMVLVSGVSLAELRQVAVTTLNSWRARWRAQRRPRPAPAVRPVAVEQQVEAEPQLARPEDKPEATAKAEPEPVDTSQPGLFYGDAVRAAASDYTWELPRVEDVLQPGTEVSAADVQIREQTEIIEHTLASLGAPGRVVEVNRGPVITQYGVEPQYLEQRSGRRVKVKVGQINSLADDLALALAAKSIRIEAPVPGRSYVGIEVPNVEVSLVSLRDVMESQPFTKIKSPLSVGLGQDVSGHAIAADLAQMPHLLIAGATGSGKSVCVNSVVACLLLQNTPEQLRLLIVDPKRVELTSYNGIPHLLMPVIVDLEKVVGALQWVTREMDARYRKFAEAGVRNIEGFNRQAGGDKLPFIVVVVDELADLMMIAPDETERTVCRLAQMARATGIHLIISTQRPSVDVVTGLIKANFPARIAFAVASSTDSRVILDTTGAERLLGRGDLLFVRPDAAQPLRMQGCYVSDRELLGLVDYWRRQRVAAVQAGKAAREQPEEGEPPAEPAVQQSLWEEVIEIEPEPAEQDPMLDEAIATVRQLQKASVSLLQRRLRVGYTRAARLIDEMEARGVVGPHPGGSRQREVLLPAEDQE